MNINVQSVLADVPDFESFCSVEQLQELVSALPKGAGGFEVKVVGQSAAGRPIEHVKFGRGGTRALFVGFPHPNEPVGGLTTFSLLSLLKSGHPALIHSGVEWHIVPCIDPDGAALNEGWTQQPFKIRNFMEGSFRQEPRDQVERSFPIKHKRLNFDRPSLEAQVLQGILASVRPDFFHSLHNARMGGASCFLSHRLRDGRYKDIYDVLESQEIPMHKGGSPLEGGLDCFSPGIWEMFTVRKYYDHLEQTLAKPELGVHNAGACSWEFLAEVKPDAQAFVMELPYLRHPMSGSSTPIGLNFRREKLRTDADNKYLITVILEEWDKVHTALDPASPFYRKTKASIVDNRSVLVEGLPSWEAGTTNLLVNPGYSREMTEADLFYNCMYDRFYPLCNSYEFIRLLRETEPSPEIDSALARLLPIYEDALDELDRKVDFSAFELIPLRNLVRAQLGGGLAVLNSVLSAVE